MMSDAFGRKGVMRLVPQKAILVVPRYYKKCATTQIDFLNVHELFCGALNNGSELK